MSTSTTPDRKERDAAGGKRGVRLDELTGWDPARGEFVLDRDHDRPLYGPPPNSDTPAKEPNDGTPEQPKPGPQAP